MKKKRPVTKRPAASKVFVAPELPPHAYVVTRPVRGSDIPMELTFILTRDEIYTPVSIRKPPGAGPFPVIVMARGNGRGGYPHVETQVERLATMQDRMIARGYAVAYPNYRNEIPHLYEREDAVKNLADDVSGGDKRTLKSAPSLDSDDFIAVIRYLDAQPGAQAGAI